MLSIIGKRNRCVVVAKSNYDFLATLWSPANIGPILLSHKSILSLPRLGLSHVIPSSKVTSFSIKNHCCQCTINWYFTKTTNNNPVFQNTATSVVCVALDHNMLYVPSTDDLCYSKNIYTFKANISNSPYVTSNTASKNANDHTTFDSYCDIQVQGWGKGQT